MPLSCVAGVHNNHGNISNVGGAHKGGKNTKTPLRDAFWNSVKVYD